MKLMEAVGDVTFDEFCATVDDGQKADLINGVIYMASPDNTEANELNVWMASILSAYSRRKKLGKVYSSRVALRLSKTNGPEPDVVFVKRERLHLVKRGFIAGPADFVVEIVSPDSIERDYVDKRRQYQRFGVPEYLILDPLKQCVTFLRLGSDKKYHQVRPTKGILQSEAVPGFWFRQDWFWQDPLPDEFDIVSELLNYTNSRKSMNRPGVNGAI